MTKIDEMKERFWEKWGPTILLTFDEDKHRFVREDIIADLQEIVDEAVREREICRCIRLIKWRVDENFCSLCGGRRPPEGGE